MAFFSMMKVLLLCTTSLSLLTTPASGQTSSYLLSNERLNTGEALIQGSDNFTIGNDCNLVLYNSGDEIWSSNTKDESSGCYLTLQRNGNLIIYNKNGIRIWNNKGPEGKDGNYILILLTSHNVVIYGPTIWSIGKSTYGSNDVDIATALKGTTGVSSEEQNNMRKMGKTMKLMSNE
ncbi:mannose-specific lectin-like [Dendrobium catenatum]|uniref:Curculin-2 n=1 Tax=Dendrobium catenatum TaxID=906689 RepID=A0A2I0VXA7_9ASPA|nr:mannose-specific lectin-like [Dendrobium catenatum]PKU68035.1 Curculin-2 [Dendrobium catenatum]